MKWVSPHCGSPPVKLLFPEPTGLFVSQCKTESRKRFLNFGHGSWTILEIKGKILIYVTNLWTSSGKNRAEVVFPRFIFVFVLDASQKPADSWTDAPCTEWQGAVPIHFSGRELPVNRSLQLSSSQSLTEMWLWVFAFCLPSWKWFGKRKGNAFCFSELFSENC